MNGVDADVTAAIAAATDGGNLGVSAGRELRRFARAILSWPPERVPADVARRDLLDALGPEAVGDTAGIAAFFDAINRIADGTGANLETPLREAAASLLGVSLPDDG